MAAASSPPREFVFDTNYPPDVECAVCLTPWTQPAEIRPCGHIFCRDCISGQQRCPHCRGKVQGREPPNRVLVNIVGNLRGKCSTCGWCGPRSVFLESHSRAPCQAGRALNTPFNDDECHDVEPLPAGCESAGNFLAFFANAAASITSPPASAERLQEAPVYGNINVAVITDESEVTPLRYRTVSMDCSLGTLFTMLCEDGALAATAVIFNDHIVTSDGRELLKEIGLQRGSTLYFVRDELRHNRPLVELVRIRSALDELVRSVRRADAVQHVRPADHQHWAEKMSQLLMRINAHHNADLSNDLRGLKRHLTHEVSECDEVFARLAPQSGTPPLGRSASSGPVSGPSRSPQHGPSPPPAHNGSFMSNTSFARGEHEPWHAYNMSQRMYETLFVAFNGIDANGQGSLSMPEVRRLFAWCNLPFSDETLLRLFDMFGADAVHGRVVFHMLCVWVQGNQRQPLDEYGLTFDRYYAALDAYHALDADMSCGLTPSEAVQFIAAFGDKPRAVATTLVDTIIARHRGLSVTAANAPPGTIAALAAATGEELALDDVLRTMYTYDQGWDECDDVDGMEQAPPRPRPMDTHASAMASRGGRPRAVTASAAPAGLGSVSAPASRAGRGRGSAAQADAGPRTAQRGGRRSASFASAPSTHARRGSDAECCVM